MLCSNSMYHGDEFEIESDYQRTQELKDYEAEENAIDEWKSSRND